MTTPAIPYEPLLFGESKAEGIVAVEHVPQKHGDAMVVFVRRDGMVSEVSEPFHPFLIANATALEAASITGEQEPLQGPGVLDTLVHFQTWQDAVTARRRLVRETGFSPSTPLAPYLFVSDPVQQFLMQTGKTHFLGLAFEDLVRLQVDIECFTAAGYDFCNADRGSDRIIAIALSDQTGWSTVLSGADLDEPALLERFVQIVQDRDPDIVEGHNLFNFDLPYLAKRAERHGITLALGRDRSAPRQRPSRFSAGERVIGYTRFDIYGRHVVDTLFLVQAYDVVHRELDGYGLKSAAIHFGITADERTYIEGSQISAVFLKTPERLVDYVRDDAMETGRLARLLSRSNFVQAQMLPFSYQNVCVRGNAVKIDALFMRAYLRHRQALPQPAEGRAFAGGYTDMFEEGVIRNVHHCDVRSLYPSLMLTQLIGPASDALGIFLEALASLRTFRVDAKQAMNRTAQASQKVELDALQSAFKILINSFYGYLGFTQGRFNDFDAADKVTREGRKLLREMIEWLRAHGARPIEIDTDGIYFVPPPCQGGSDVEAAEEMAFREAFAAALPKGIEIEFDGEYVSMYSYKMKNYALLEHSGEMIIKGAALKSRGLERYQRTFMREMLRLRLEGRDAELPALRKVYDDAIVRQEWPIDVFAKTENLQNSPERYAARRARGEGSRRAAYELALTSEREYKVGDQVSYYVTGDKKNVAVCENSKLVVDWDFANRDENVTYYRSKLDALYKKFTDAEPEDARQGELF